MNDKLMKLKEVTTAIKEGLQKAEVFKRPIDRAFVIEEELEKSGFRINYKARKKEDTRQQKLFEGGVR